MSRFPSVALATAVVRDGETSFVAARGPLEQGNTAAADIDTLFAIASITKTFTATLAAILVDQGHLAWDDRVIDHLPAIRFPDAIPTEEVTLLDLLLHRTGMGRTAVLEWTSGFTTDEIIERLRHGPVIAPFRSGASYTNIAYVIAGKIMEKATGTDWADLVSEHIFHPLGMNRSRARFEAEAPDNIALPHIDIDGIPHAFERLDRTQHAPASVIYSSASDMAAWAALHAGGGVYRGRRLFSAEACDMLHRARSLIDLTQPVKRAKYPVAVLAGQAVGWQVRDHFGRSISSHDGSVRGYAPDMLVVPGDGIGCVVLANHIAPQATYAVLHQVADTELDARQTDWHAAAQRLAAIEAGATAEATRADLPIPPEERLGSLAGRWSSPVLGLLDVHCIEGALSFAFDRFPQENRTLVPLGGTLFEEHYHDPATAAVAGRPFIMLPELGESGLAEAITVDLGTFFRADG